MRFFYIKEYKQLKQNNAFVVCFSVSSYYMKKTELETALYMALKKTKKVKKGLAMYSGLFLWWNHQRTEP